LTQLEKLLSQVLSGRTDKNIAFNDLCKLLQRLGFEERVRGSHHIFVKDDVDEILNLQPKADDAKPYRVKQVRQVVLKYGLKVE